jgi:hypothetical protein
VVGAFKFYKIGSLTGIPKFSNLEFPKFQIPKTKEPPNS